MPGSEVPTQPGPDRGSDQRQLESCFWWGAPLPWHLPWGARTGKPGQTRAAESWAQDLPFPFRARKIVALCNTERCHLNVLVKEGIGHGWQRKSRCWPGLWLSWSLEVGGRVFHGAQREESGFLALYLKSCGVGAVSYLAISKCVSLSVSTPVSALSPLPQNLSVL